ncbi:hypothetical protein [Variovorax sp.]|jgi:hypothetical protein|uniref:hypothetical protein n=1 Tax=Variovorax sp. TaxID=1871043 RepID=UPI00121093B0|nr:MAG: hypothetical protein EPO53_22390 [Variovorax sp.]
MKDAASIDRRSALLRLAMPLAAGLAGTAGAQPAPGRKLVLLVQRGSPNAAVDEQVAQHLGTRGFAVAVLDQAVGPAAAAGAELVVISSTVAAKDVHPGWRQLPVPLLTWENDLLDDLAMTGKRHDVDFGEAAKERYLWLVNAPHPMGAGLPAGVANVYVRQAGMSWGRPGLGATTIATLYGQPEKAAIFGYEKGATMDYESLAPARRVMVFLGNDGFTNLAPAGRALFDAAVDWAAGAR